MNDSLNKIKKRFSRLFGENYRNDSNYQYLIDQYKDNSAYFSVYKKSFSDKWSGTNVKICFSESLYLGSNRSHIHRVLGHPVYHIRSLSPLKTELLVYKRLIGNHKVTCQMHLYNNQLFLYSYTFQYINESDKEQIMDIIKMKYLHDTGKYTGQNIIDDFNNCLQIENGIDFKISYLYPKSVNRRKFQ